MADLFYQRGDVVWIRIGSKEAAGHEQKENRPAIVVQNDISNKNLTTTIVIPLTDAANIRKLGPNHVLIKKGAGNLAKDSIALCHQITTVDVAKRVLARIGCLDKKIMSEIGTAMKITLAIED
jgi:mRNA interferase MazF